MILLLIQCFGVERHQGAGVDVDVPEAGGDRFGDQVFDFLNRAFRVFFVLRSFDLKVVALDKDRVEISLFDRSGNRGCGIFGGRLFGVTHFAARNLEDKGASVTLLRRP